MRKSDISVKERKVADRMRVLARLARRLDIEVRDLVDEDRLEANR